MSRKKMNKSLEDFSQWRCRPRRKIIKPCLDYSQVLLREEEQALKKALYVSLRDSKADQDGTSHSSKGKNENNLDTATSVEPNLSESKAHVQVKKRKHLKPLELESIPQTHKEGKKPKFKELDCEPELFNAHSFSRLDTCTTSMCQNTASSCNTKDQEISISKRTRRQLRAQRKFAHSQPCSPSSLLLQRMGTSSDSRPKTEDFIKFLCLRGTASLPKELEFFNNPALPPSPLSPDKDEYLPVSPFFKRQVEGASTLNKSEVYGSYRRQLECEFSDVLSSNESLNEREKTTSSQTPNSLCSETENSQSSLSPNHSLNVPCSPSSALATVDDYDTDNKSASLLETFIEAEQQTGKEFQQGEFVAHMEDSTSKDKLSECYVKDTLHRATCSNRGQNSKSSDCADKYQAESSVGSKDTETDEPKAKDQNEVRTDILSWCADASYSAHECDVGKRRSALHKASKNKPKTKSNLQGRNGRTKGSRLDGNLYESELESAPTFRPMEQEFKDPMKYIRKMTPFILKYGICILVPPAGWQPSSNVSDDIRFGTKIQHIHRMRERNPETTKFLMCLHRCLGETSDLIESMPQIGSCEVDLLLMSKAFQNAGGVAKVNTPRKWHKIADSLHIPKNAQGRINKLQDIYYKYVLPFDILSYEEKEKIKNDVEQDDGGFASQEPESKGRSASVSSFHRIASNAQEMYGRGQTNTQALEDDFWNAVTVGKRHVAALSGDIDTMNFESSFHIARSKSGWNVSSLPQSQGSILRYLGVVPGLTTSSLKFSSVFSTNEWQKSDDNLFKIEYLHAGASRMWYAVPSYMETAFRQKVKKLMPGVGCIDDEMPQFLASPLELVSDDCRISRAVQNEGHFILCLPNVYHCVFSSGYCLTESCYFAPVDWLDSRIDKETTFITPAKKCPAEMIILNYAKSVVQNSRKTENTRLILQLVEAIRDETVSNESKLLLFGVQKSDAIPHGRNRRFAVDWEVCCTCGRPLYPLMIWTDSYFYCADHAMQALENESGTTKTCYMMYRHWENEQLDGLIAGIEKLYKDEND